MMQVDHRFEENLTPEKVDALFERLRSAPAPRMVKPMERASQPVPGPPPVQRASGATAAAEEKPSVAAKPVTVEKPEEKPEATTPVAEEKVGGPPVIEQKPKRTRNRKAPTPTVPGEVAESGAEGKRARSRRSQK